jgi:glycosyltransferase involved in cell wall biosynthesis
VLLLALSFGLPVVAPENLVTDEITTPGAVRTFQPDDPGGLTSALAGADDLLTPEARQEALRIARRYDPGEIAERFASALVDRVAAGWPATTANWPASTVRPARSPGRPRPADHRPLP